MLGYDSDVITTEYIVTQQVIESQTYNFRIRAKNKWGWGNWSTVLVVVASSWPSIVDKPVTAIESNTGNVQVTWNEPATRGAPITKYVIEFGDAVSSSIWLESSVNCNGQSSTLMQNANKE